MDRIVSKSTKMGYYDSFISVYEHSFRVKTDQSGFLRRVAEGYNLFLKNVEKKRDRYFKPRSKNWRSQNRHFSSCTSIWTKKSCHACSLASMKQQKIGVHTHTRRWTWIFWTFATQKPLRGNKNPPLRLKSWPEFPKCFRFLLLISNFRNFPKQFLLLFSDFRNSQGSYY